MTYNTEAGTVIGNVERKYDAQNPIARMLMDGFLKSFDELVSKTGSQTVLEVGCGEGHLSRRMTDRGIAVRSCDFSEQIIAEAKALHGESGISFFVQSIYDLTPDIGRAPLVVCCEVLEHLEDPETGLAKLADMTEDWCILSVPREPIWRMLNMARLKYLGDMGNTPGHLQHWSKSGFIRFVSRHFQVEDVRSPLPWTMLLCRPRG